MNSKYIPTWNHIFLLTYRPKSLLICFHSAINITFPRKIQCEITSKYIFSKWHGTPQPLILKKNWSQQYFFSLSRWELIGMYKIRVWVSIVIGIIGNVEVIATYKDWTIVRPVQHNNGTLVFLCTNICGYMFIWYTLQGEQESFIILAIYRIIECPWFIRNPPNMKPPVLRITEMVKPLLSHLSWNPDDFQSYCEPQYRNS